MKSIEYRLATPGDAAALASVGDELFDFPIKPQRLQEFLADERHHLLLACVDECVVGMASAFHYIHPDKNPAMFINEVSVLEEYRNQGIARTLVRELVNYGRGLECKDFWVATEHSNVAARKAYRAAGFIEDAEPVV
ncbi:MAG: GNAT family N-acetyltransferase, partial [Gammaproteobacteria bacterium]